MATKKKRSLPLLIIAILVIAGAVYYFGFRKPSTIVLTGIVTTDSVRVSPMIEGRIQKLMVDSGDTVKKGQLIARIQPEENQADVTYYQNLEKESGAQVAQAKAQLKLLEAQTRDQIKQAEANLAMSQAQQTQAEADLENAESNYNREKSLHDQNVNSPQEFDQVRATYQSAKAHVDALKKQVQASEAALSLAKASADEIAARKAALEASSHGFAAAGAQAQKAEVRLGYTEVRAPINGIVDVRAALQGEVVTPGQPIITLVNPDDLWIRADVEESYIDRIHLGEKMQVRLPSGQVRQGTVFFRGVDADYATQRDVSRTKRDIKTFEIRLRCDNKDRSLALGMTAYVLLPLN